MARCAYQEKFEEFLKHTNKEILGTLSSNYHGSQLSTQTEALEIEIDVIKEIIKSLNTTGYIIFEYDIPRLGKRIDVTLLIKGIIFCLEFKAGEKNILEADIDQVLDYALDLKNFHKLSEDRVIVPILIATKYKGTILTRTNDIYFDRVYKPLYCGENGLFELIKGVLDKFPNETALGDEWVNSPYAPTPTIIEAARSLYINHSVENITKHEADKVTTDRTIECILNIIKHSKENKEKSICFVTGVPGAGKTLVGLDVAIKQTYQNSDEPINDEGAVYL